MFIEVHDLNDKSSILLNVDDISRIEERRAGSIVYMRGVADDFDGTKHQISVLVAENYSDVKMRLTKIILP